MLCSVLTGHERAFSLVLMQLKKQKKLLISTRNFPSFLLAWSTADSSPRHRAWRRALNHIRRWRNALKTSTFFFPPTARKEDAGLTRQKDEDTAKRNQRKGRKTEETRLPKLKGKKKTRKKARGSHAYPASNLISSPLFLLLIGSRRYFLPRVWSSFNHTRSRSLSLVLFFDQTLFKTTLERRTLIQSEPFFAEPISPLPLYQSKRPIASSVPTELFFPRSLSANVQEIPPCMLL